MKRFVKTCLIAGSFCVLVGGGITTISAALGGSLWKLMPQGKHEQQTYDRGNEIFSSADIKKLDLVICTGNVIFVEGSRRSDVKIFCNREAACYSLKNDKDKLQLEEYAGWNRENEPELNFTIQVPRGFCFSQVNIKSSGQLKCWINQKGTGPSVRASVMSAKELNIDAQVSSIKIEGGSVGELYVECNVGAVEFSGTTTGDIEALCQSGAIRLDLTGKKEDYNYEIECNMGAINLGDEDIAAITGDKQRDNGADKDMELECNTGVVQVNFMNES